MKLRAGHCTRRWSGSARTGYHGGPGRDRRKAGCATTTCSPPRARGCSPPKRPGSGQRHRRAVQAGPCRGDGRDRGSRPWSGGPAAAGLVPAAVPGRTGRGDPRGGGGRRGTGAAPAPCRRGRGPDTERGADAAVSRPVRPGAAGPGRRPGRFQPGCPAVPAGRPRHPPGGAAVPLVRRAAPVPPVSAGEPRDRRRGPAPGALLRHLGRRRGGHRGARAAGPALAGAAGDLRGVRLRRRVQHVD